MPCKTYLIDMLLVQAGNDKQREVWLVLHLHNGARISGYRLAFHHEQLRLRLVGCQAQ